MGVYPATLGPVFPATAGALPWEQGGDARPPGSLSLLSGGTFTRSTEGSYLIGAPTDGSTAFLAWAGVDVRRIEDRGDGLGSMLLMEGSRTNELIYTEDFTQASWTKVSDTITADASAAPSGAVTADAHVMSASANARAQLTITTVLSGESIALSQFARSATAQAVRTAFAGKDSGDYRSADQATGSAWARLEFVASAGVGASNVQARTPINASDGAARTVYIWGSQLERNAYFPSSYIRSTGAAATTRGADSLSYATGAYPTSFLNSGFTIAVAPDESSAEVISHNSDRRIMQVGASDYVRIRKNTNCVVELVCGGVVVATLTVTYSRYQALTISARPLAGLLTVSGATTGNGTNTGTGAAWASASTLYVGTDNVGTSSFYGRLSTTATGL